MDIDSVFDRTIHLLLLAIGLADILSRILPPDDDEQ